MYVGLRGLNRAGGVDLVTDKSQQGVENAK